MSLEEILADLRAQRVAKNLPPLLKREFTALNSIKGEKHVRVMQWNILAHALCHGDDNFVLCSPDALCWENRKYHILEEILSYDPTIICLEEVDRCDVISHTLSKVGYSGCFLPKPDSPCLYTPDSVGPDGCAVFWKKDVVKMVKQEDIILCDIKNRETNQVCLLCHFELLAPQDGGKERRFIVAATHFKAKSGYEELRRQQAQDIVRLFSEVPRGTPIVLCGDLNASPSEEVYSVLKGSDLDLASAYAQLSPKGEEPPYTTCKVRGISAQKLSKICHTIDYIWYTSRTLAPLSLLKFPTLEEMGEKLLPSFHYPSDHLSLVCDFTIL